MSESSLPPVPEFVSPPSLWKCFCATLRKDRYAVFRGRASRREYWSCVLFGTLFTLLPLFFTPACFLLPELYGFFAGLILMLFGLGLALYYALPMTTACVRRLHDTGHSAWWLVLSLGTFCFTYAFFVFSMIQVLIHGVNMIDSFPVHTTIECPQVDEALLESLMDAQLEHMIIERFLHGSLWWCQSIFVPLTTMASLPLLIFTLLPGQRKTNSYGEMPKW